MNPLIERLKELVQNGTIKDFDLEEEVPTMKGDTQSRLVDKSLIIFPDGQQLWLATHCSGCMENSSLELDERGE